MDETIINSQVIRYKMILEDSVKMPLQIYDIMEYALKQREHALLKLALLKLREQQISWGVNYEPQIFQRIPSKLFDIAREYTNNEGMFILSHYNKY